MNSENLLTGKWQFIGAEKHTGSRWQPTTHVEGMAWEFLPQYFSENKIIGNIVETTPTTPPIEMAYMYNKRDRLLKIDRYIYRPHNRQ